MTFWKPCKSTLLAFTLAAGVAYAGTSGARVVSGILSAEEISNMPKCEGSMTGQFGQSCHPHRWPHGPSGPNFIEIERSSEGWKQAVLECRDKGETVLLREKRVFLRSAPSLTFTGLPDEVNCDVTLKSGGPKTVFPIQIPSKSENAKDTKQPAPETTPKDDKSAGADSAKE